MITVLLLLRSIVFTDALSSVFAFVGISRGNSYHHRALAIASPHRHPHGRVASILIRHAHANEEDDGTSANEGADGPPSPQDLDQRKLELEKLMSSKAVQRDESIPVLTASRRRSLEKEIELLQQLDPDVSNTQDLNHEGNIMAQFWSIWYGERGPMNERKLRTIEDMLVVDDEPSTWAAAETKYLELIYDHCGSNDGNNAVENLNLANWIEPANRLATLLYMMGRLDESKKWCEEILKAKPWHIGALSGVVMVCMKLNDEEGVIKWASKGLPRLTPQTLDARRAWVTTNTDEAKRKLLEMEEINKRLFEVADENVSEECSGCTDSGDSSVISEYSAWQ
eukprot:scaffold2067_cov158-Alexandrium_tamarense.AAC.2